MKPVLAPACHLTVIVVDVSLVVSVVDLIDQISRIIKVIEAVVEGGEWFGRRQVQVRNYLGSARAEFRSFVNVLGLPL